MGRRPCCSKVGLNRGSWSAREDSILKNYILAHGEGKWRDLPRRAGLQRCGKSCRLRWLNYLRPDIKRGNITKEEEELIIRLHNLLGNRWSLIAGRLPGRTDNEIKNYWNTNLSKRLNGLNTNSCSSPSTVGAETSPATTPWTKKNKKARDSRRRPRGTNAASPPQSHSVVRTKAVRCTGIYAGQNDDDEVLLIRRNRESNANAATEINLHRSTLTPGAQPMLDFDDDPLALDLFMGMDVDHFMSEMQGPHDLLQECCAGDGEQVDRDGDGSAEVVCPDHALRLEEQVLEEWKDCLRPKVENDDFEELFSFLDE